MRLIAGAVPPPKTKFQVAVGQRFMVSYENSKPYKRQRYWDIDVPLLGRDFRPFRTRFSPYRGKRKTASAPLPPRRFVRLSEPPCASEIWRLSASPMPDPPGLVVKKGTNRFVGFMIPGPSS